MEACGPAVLGGGLPRNKRAADYQVFAHQILEERFHCFPPSFTARDQVGETKGLARLEHFGDEAVAGFLAVHADSSVYCGGR
jgi:hypothetical protein